MTERRLPSRFRDGVMSFVDPRRVPADMPFTPWSTIPLKIRPVAKHVRSLFDRAAQEEKDHSVPRLAGFLTAKSGSYDNNWTGDLSGVSVAMYWHELVYDHPVGTPARFALLVKVSGVHERAGFNLARSISLLAQGPWGTLPTESIMRTGHAIVPDAAYAVIILTEAARSFHRGMLSDSTNIRPGRLPNTYALTYPSQDAVWKMTPLQLRNMECILEFLTAPRLFFVNKFRALGIPVPAMYRRPERNPEA